MKKINLLKDIYYLKEYVSLYLSDKSSLFEFEYKEGKNVFYNISVKTPIEKIGSQRIFDGYFDLQTAHGYGGYFSNSENSEFLQKAFDNYISRCNTEGIISEFLRFHPYNNFPVIHTNYLDFNLSDRQTVSIKLNQPKEIRWSNYSSTTRNILRKIDGNLTFSLSNNIEEFSHLYEKTMERNHAEKFYYFSDEYFKKLKEIDSMKIFQVSVKGKTASMALVLIGPELAHYHLAASDSEFSQFNPNHYLIDSICDYINKKFSNVSYLHLGGGRTNLADDSLLAFKSKFSQTRNDFVIGGKIFDIKTYDKYIAAISEEYLGESDLFLKYRLEF